MSLIISVSGIRGTIGKNPGENLTPIDIMKFALGYGTWLNQKFKHNKVVIGRDARISGQMVESIVCSTLQSLGIDIIQLGLSTTPTVELAVLKHKSTGGIIITASHNPENWNALKLLNHLGEFISEEDGNEVAKLSNIAEYNFVEVDKLGQITKYDTAIQDHVESIVKLPIIPLDLIRSKKFHIIADCINSTGAIALPKLFDALGCTYELINSDMTGKFTHNPEPLSIHLSELTKICATKKSLGMAVDPDVDRLALIDETGYFIGEEYTLVCAADYVLSMQAGNTVSNLSSSRALKDLTTQNGSNYYSSKVGEVHVVKKMKAVNAVIGGEGNGGIILPALHYGRDALVGIALILANMAKNSKSLVQLHENYNKYFMEKDKIELKPEINYYALIDFIKMHYRDQNINLEDGLKIDLEYGWLHLRKSNTEPIIRIYSEAKSQEEAQNLIKDIFKLIEKFSN